MVSYSNDYRGARFYKCDLHMHTPVDRSHWLSPPLESFKDEQEAAEAYIRCCYKAGLEVIGITDHNFVSKDFIPLLYKAIKKFEPEFGYKITIFPGFEFMADVGRGCHILVLMSPGCDLNTIDHLLTQCGVPYPRFDGNKPRASTKRLPEILEIIQSKADDGLLQGIVICPHAQSDAGIFDNDRIADWLQKEEFINPELLCIEVPKPPSEMSMGWQRLLRAGPDCNPEWRRTRPIACIMSSDAKGLQECDCTENYIGYRYTWIKMSNPSIEALRQAFLDHESRIRFGPIRPENHHTHPRIRRIIVSGAKFLDDLEVEFSDNLNALIGGRGSGKSTLIEYLRIALSKSGPTGEEAKKNFEKLRRTITSDTIIRIVFEKDGQEWILESKGGDFPEVVKGSPVPDITRFFPVHIFSQREIYSISENRFARTQLVDEHELARSELSKLKREAEEIVAEIRQLNQQVVSQLAIEEQERIVKTELLELQVRLESLKKLEEPLAQWKGFLVEEKLFEEIKTHTSVITNVLRQALERIVTIAQVISGDLPETPNKELVGNIVRDVSLHIEKLHSSVSSILEDFESSINNTILYGQPVQEWRKKYEAAKTGYNELRRQLTESGVDPDQYLNYQKELREKQDELKSLQKRLKEVKSAHDRLEKKIAELQEIWKKETEIRINVAEQLMGKVPKTRNNQPFVTIAIEPFGDDKAFLEKMKPFLKDRRRISDEEWDSFICEAFKASRTADSPKLPTEILRSWVEALREGKEVPGCPWSSRDRKIQALLEWMNHKTLTNLRMEQIPDRVRIKLYRQDGSEVGELEEGLSVGQRCTAILALLLAADNVPAIIDQPEDDLDNEFVYHELVPMLRELSGKNSGEATVSRSQRQIIVATHNANIPVNADAELIIALEARNNRGIIRALGALDQVSVSDAVKEIMEGSEDAFRKRFEKYGF